MPLPLLAGLGAVAGGAAAKGISNLVAGQEEEERAKREAMRQLYNSYGSGNYQMAPEPPEAPDAFSSIVMPVGGAILGQLGEDEEEGQSAGKSALKGFSRGFSG